jgi:phenylalanyl-tRNA synthetase alpha chain
MDAQAYDQRAREAIAGANDVAALDAARVSYLGRKSELKQALREVRDRESGMQLNTLREALEQAIAERRKELEDAEMDRKLHRDSVDITLPGRRRALGRLHPITQVRREVEDVFLGLGYQIFDDREVETVEDNFDALAFPQWHPARADTDSYFLDADTVLRTETSPSQIHIMRSRKPPIYMVSLGRCYRRESIDATHYTTFLQFEGLAVDHGLSMAHLKGTLRHVMRALYGEEREVRFRTHYFPFTEPSLEPDISCPFCAGDGCAKCKGTGWLEMGGAGMVDPAVFEAVDYGPDTYTGFAFGMGLERTVILRHGVPDIRFLWQDDLRFLRQF